ncbi:esterase/lipase family protein [Planctomonas psychrotolerans]|uniref:esterase/lipase family protein n=1 Tax=Planctomonas psychrotolerans TaxID=2528712 RepID=UPI00123B44AA|nr:alpha/beta hydrolase [Planctomonas psychrotolerans]
MRRLIRNGVSWFLDYAYVGYWQVVGFLFRRDPERYRNGVEAPVLILPGIYERWQFLLPVIERLHRAGHPIHVVTTLGYNTGDVVSMAKLCRHYVEEADLRGVIIVAHSKGGLIGKYLMAFGDPEERVTAMVAINTPFGGSRYARFFFTRPIRAFVPTHETLLALAKRKEINPRITSVFSEFDPHIPESSALVDAHNVKLPTGGHFRVLAEPELLTAVERAVEAAPRR